MISKIGSLRYVISYLDFSKKKKIKLRQKKKKGWPTGGCPTRCLLPGSPSATRSPAKGLLGSTPAAGSSTKRLFDLRLLDHRPRGYSISYLAIPSSSFSNFSSNISSLRDQVTRPFFFSFLLHVPQVVCIKENF